MIESTWGRLLLSTVLGAAIGWERFIDRKSAGLRTHTLVCLGATAFVVAGERAPIGAQLTRTTTSIRATRTTRPGRPRRLLRRHRRLLERGAHEVAGGARREPRARGERRDLLRAQEFGERGLDAQRGARLAHVVEHHLHG